MTLSRGSFVLACSLIASKINISRLTTINNASNNLNELQFIHTVMINIHHRVN